MSEGEILPDEFWHAYLLAYPEAKNQTLTILDTVLEAPHIQKNVIKHFKQETNNKIDNVNKLLTTLKTPEIMKSPVLHPPQMRPLETLKAAAVCARFSNRCKRALHKPTKVNPPRSTQQQTPSCKR